MYYSYYSGRKALFYFFISQQYIFKSLKTKVEEFGEFLLFSGYNVFFLNKNTLSNAFFVCFFVCFAHFFTAFLIIVQPQQQPEIKRLLFPIWDDSKQLLDPPAPVSLPPEFPVSCLILHNAIRMVFSLMLLYHDATFIKNIIIMIIVIVIKIFNLWHFFCTLW